MGTGGGGPMGNDTCGRIALADGDPRHWAKGPEACGLRGIGGADTPVGRGSQGWGSAVHEFGKLVGVAGEFDPLSQCAASG